MHVVNRPAARGVEQSACEAEDRRQFDELVFCNACYPADHIDHQHADSVGHLESNRHPGVGVAVARDERQGKS